MLNAVPVAVAKASRNVVLRHPNSIAAVALRKVVTRTSSDTQGGMPTIAGTGVLVSEDEVDYDYEELGPCMVLMTGAFNDDDANMQDSGGSLIYAPPPVNACVEPIAEPATSGYFTLEQFDMVTLTPGAGIALSYEVIGVNGNINIPPYTRRYILNPRQDAHVGV